MKTILVADDCNAMVFLISELIADENEDYRILTATTGTEAMRRLVDGEDINLLISDLEMPGFDGISVIKAFREANPSAPAILMTGSNKDLTQLAKESGASLCLKKPFDNILFTGAVKRLLA